MVDGQRHHLGGYHTPKDAAKAYDLARVKLGPPLSKYAKRPVLNFARATWADTLYAYNADAGVDAKQHL